jgi:hypothetical protein
VAVGALRLAVFFEIQFMFFEKLSFSGLKMIGTVATGIGTLGDGKTSSIEGTWLNAASTTSRALLTAPDPPPVSAES